MFLVPMLPGGLRARAARRPRRRGRRRCAGRARLVATWTEGDKDGIGSATGLTSRPLFTLDDGEMTEVFAPDLGTPSIRDLQLVVSDGKTFSEREREDAIHRIELADPRSLTYRQVNTAKSGRWRITKTYVADPARDAVLVDVQFESLTGGALDLYAILDPGLSNSGDDDRARTQGATLAAYDGRFASALAASPAPSQVSSGYQSASDGWTDLRSDHRMDWAYDTASAAGNVVQTARLPLTGLGPSAAPRSRSASAPTRPPPPRPRPLRSPAGSRARPTATQRAGTTTSAASPGPPPRVASASTTSR